MGAFGHQKCPRSGFFQQMYNARRAETSGNQENLFLGGLDTEEVLVTVSSFNLLSHGTFHHDLSAFLFLHYEERGFHAGIFMAKRAVRCKKSPTSLSRNRATGACAGSFEFLDEVAPMPIVRHIHSAHSSTASSSSANEILQAPNVDGVLDESLSTPFATID